MSTIEFKFDQGVTLETVARGPLFREGDLNFFRSRNGLNKSLDSLSRGSHDIRVIIDMRTDARNSTDLEPGSRDRITITLGNNHSASWVPLTGWMICHRIGHVIQVSPLGLDKVVFKRSIHDLLSDLWCDFYPNHPMKVKDIILNSDWGDWHQAGGLEAPRGHPGHWERPDQYSSRLACEQSKSLRELKLECSSMSYLVAFFTSLMTMKSARLNVIRNEMDLFCEMFAQYMIQGEVRFNRVDKNIYDIINLLERTNTESSMYNANKRIQLPVPEIVDVEMLNNSISDIEMHLNDEFKHLLESMKGGSYSF